MGVVAHRSAYTIPSARPSIDISEYFLAYMSGGGGHLNLQRQRNLQVASTSWRQAWRSKLSLEVELGGQGWAPCDQRPKVMSTCKILEHYNKHVWVFIYGMEKEKKKINTKNSDLTKFCLEQC
jgi:hypothetical protein